MRCNPALSIALLAQSNVAVAGAVALVASALVANGSLAGAAAATPTMVAAIALFAVAAGALVAVQANLVAYAACLDRTLGPGHRCSRLVDELMRNIHRLFIATAVTEGLLVTAAALSPVPGVGAIAMFFVFGPIAVVLYLIGEADSLLWEILRCAARSLPTQVLAQGNLIVEVLACPNRGSPCAEADLVTAERTPSDTYLTGATFAVRLAPAQGALGGPGITGIGGWFEDSFGTVKAIPGADVLRPGQHAQPGAETWLVWSRQPFGELRAERGASTWTMRMTVVRASGPNEVHTVVVTLPA